MRYFTADDLVFTDATGKTVRIKDIIPMVGRSDSSFEVNCSADISLDEVASRQEAYGDGAEASAYRIFEENAVEIMESRLDMGKVRKLRIPL
jgi:hypothetical protein